MRESVNIKGGGSFQFRATQETAVGYQTHDMPSFLSSVELKCVLRKSLLQMPFQWKRFGKFVPNPAELSGRQQNVFFTDCFLYKESIYWLCFLEAVWKSFLKKGHKWILVHYHYWYKKIVLYLISWYFGWSLDVRWFSIVLLSFWECTAARRGAVLCLDWMHYRCLTKNIFEKHLQYLSCYLK